MPWFKTLNSRILRLQARSGTATTAIGFGTDTNGKEIVVGTESALAEDTNFANGSVSHYGLGSIVILAAGGIKIVDADGYWQTPTVTAASPSASPSHSASPSSSRSPSASGSPSVSPSGSASPSASTSPSGSASPST